MIDRKTLLEDVQTLLPKIEADLLERSDSSEVPEVGRTLREEYRAAQAAARTAQSFEEWRSDQITQVAAAWVLSCVFARFLEDNELVATPKIAGPGERLRRARDEHELYFRAHPTLTDRDYLLAVFDELAEYAATADVFGPHNPIRDLPNWLSGDAAGELIGFFQKVDPDTGHLVHDFTDPSWDTRFLGDLYQDLSEAARKKYALLQTPVFVEEFILDRTLDPAIAEFGLARPGYETRLEPDGRLHAGDRFRMIDPACGSSHFLLGSFARLLDRWRKKEPGAKSLVLAQRALDSVHGVDLNPYAIAIARFRLLLAALKECAVRRLKDAPGFTMHLACGDSLLHGAPGGDQETMGWSSLDHVYQPEDDEALRQLLRPRSYHAVVANPPYITPKDRALNQAYRDRYRTCHMKYSLAVPFLERIVSLAVEGGFTGQITANSFMKREFGKKLIEEFFPRVDLTHVIDTSGAYIPGHGTPTVILFARNRKPVGSTIRTVMGIRGEPSTPDDPARGLVWSAIVDQVDEPGSQSEFVSVGDSTRELFHKHPWSIGGGGAAELKEQLEENAQQILNELVTSIGFASFTGQDEAFVAPEASLRRSRLPADYRKQFVVGDTVRDWSVEESDFAFVPYDARFDAIEMEPEKPWARWIWPMRTAIGAVISFGGRTRLECGDKWWTWYRWVPEKYRTPLSIVFGEVATHNHFVLDRGGKVFKQTAPVIKLPPGATEEDHLSLLGLLNSSTACFWLKQVCHNKGSTVDQHGARQRTAPFEDFYAFNATKLAAFPVMEDRPTGFAHRLDNLAESLQSHAPSSLLRHWEVRGIMPGDSIKDSFQVCEREWTTIRERMIALQEELDWACYRLYGLIDEDLTYPGEPPPLRFGGRAFEIAMGARMASGELQTTWFERHNATPLPGPHPEWPRDYQDLVRRRMEVIKTDRNIALIEQPEYKRRWNTEPWAAQLTRALRSWLLDRLESYADFDGRMNDEGTPTAKLPIALVSVGRLADLARQDEAFHEVGALYRDDPAFDVSRLVAELVESESVPLLPVLRYKPSGLRKRAEWEKTWELQRQEDAIDARSKLPKDHPDYLTELDAAELKKKQVGTIPVPPKYTNADFLKGDYWRLRGKLDVPKERWVSFPHCEGEDGTLMVAWAGYDHLQLALAISAHYVDVQELLGGREDPRLVPLLACLVELLPWLKQWHNDIDPEFGVPMGDYFEGFLQEESRNLGLTLDEIKAWQPPQWQRAVRGRRRANG
ncbi:MAG: BREX-2 system adenine-specific DNA-methyltransferase PglX [Isosphaeraceae bacterium]|nr:BREX-2 system adenine-specific DNA-methyltransferase PglX [Isosphaeraceae bacterium]